MDIEPNLAVEEELEVIEQIMVVQQSVSIQVQFILLLLERVELEVQQLELMVGPRVMIVPYQDRILLIFQPLVAEAVLVEL